jgi:hypothetical protein
MIDILFYSITNSFVVVYNMTLCMLQDNEVMRVWLRDLRFEEYCILFVQAGYDMATISHMTPQVQ